MNKAEIAFRNKLIEIFEMCYENDTDTCTITIENSKSIFEVDLTFRARLKGEENEHQF